MNKDDFATCTVAYNDEKMIGGMLKGVEDLHNLVIISKPWRGKHIDFDKTGEIAERMGAEVIYRDFDSQKDERNFGFEYLEGKGYKYVLVFDTDEYLTKERVHEMIRFIIDTKADEYVMSNQRIYWKSWKYHYRHHGGTVGVKSDKRFLGKRDIIKDAKKLSIPGNIAFHHFTYSVSLPKMLDKMCSREYTVLDVEWIREYWANWRPGENYKDYKIETTKDIPEEILGRYIKSINLLY